MDNPKNLLKQALLKKQKQIGLWSTLSSNYTVEVLAGAGFDYHIRSNIALFGAVEGMTMTDESRIGSAKGGLRVGF